MSGELKKFAGKSLISFCSTASFRPRHKMGDATHEQAGYDFRKQFNKVASRLTKDEAYSLSYIYGVDIPSNRTDALPMLLHVFTSLERKGLLTPDRDGVTFLLRDILEAIDRQDIKKGMSTVSSSSPLKQKKITHYIKRVSVSAVKKKNRQPKITRYIKRNH